MREKEMMTAMNRFVLAILLSISVSVTACKEKTDSTANQEKTNAVAENKKIPEKGLIFSVKCDIIYKLF